MRKPTKKRMPYRTRLERYEAEKKRIAATCSSYYEYEQKMKALARKYEI